VLHSNSGWIACDVPSITYGLRGVVHCNIEASIPPVPLYIYPRSFTYIFADVQISSGSTKDSHSGIDGGAWDEPMQDM